MKKNALQIGPVDYFSAISTPQDFEGEISLTVLLRSLIMSDTEPAPQYSMTIHRSLFLK